MIIIKITKKKKKIGNNLLYLKWFLFYYIYFLGFELFICYLKLPL